MRSELRKGTTAQPATGSAQAPHRYRRPEHANLTTIASDILFALPRAKRPRLDDESHTQTPRFQAPLRTTPSQHYETGSLLGPQLSTEGRAIPVELEALSSTEDTTNNVRTAEPTSTYTPSALQNFAADDGEKSSAPYTDLTGVAPSNVQSEKTPQLGTFQVPGNQIDYDFTIIGDAVPIEANPDTDTGTSFTPAYITDYVMDDSADGVGDTALMEHEPLVNPPHPASASPITPAFIEPMSDSVNEVESRASSTAAIEGDTAFKPFKTPDDDEEPLFLPSPVSSPQDRQTPSSGVPDLSALSDHWSAGPRPGYQVYVELPLLSEVQKQQYRSTEEQMIDNVVDNDVLEADSASEMERRVKTPLTVISSMLSTYSKKTDAIGRLYFLHYDIFLTKAFSVLSPSPSPEEAAKKERGRFSLLLFFIFALMFFFFFEQLSMLLH